MTQDKRTSDVCPMVYWVKRGQCDNANFKPCLDSSPRNKEFLAKCVKLPTYLQCFWFT